MQMFRLRSRLARRGSRASLRRRALGYWWTAADNSRRARLEAEAAWLECLANTQRLEGDYVSAQATERDLAALLAAPKRPR